MKSKFSLVTNFDNIHNIFLIVSGMFGCRSNQRAELDATHLVMCTDCCFTRFAHPGASNIQLSDSCVNLSHDVCEFHAITIPSITAVCALV